MAKVLIIGLMVWKSGPPTIRGPDIVLSAAIKVRTVMAKMVGFIVGRTTRNTAESSEHPSICAASSSERGIEL